MYCCVGIVRWAVVVKLKKVGCAWRVGWINAYSVSHQYVVLHLPELCRVYAKVTLNGSNCGRYLQRSPPFSL